MKSKIAGIVILIILIFLITSGLFDALTKFFVWLVTLNMTKSSISMAGEIFVKLAAFAISYSAVGFIFNALKWFDKDIMKLAYFIISTLVSFALCYLVMIFETHLFEIVIATGVAITAIIAYAIIRYIQNKKSNAKVEEKANE